MCLKHFDRIPECGFARDFVICFVYPDITSAIRKIMLDQKTGININIVCNNTSLPLDAAVSLTLGR